jgi:hypothetical protein
MIQKQLEKLPITNAEQNFYYTSYFHFLALLYHMCDRLVECAMLLHCIS